MSAQLIADPVVYVRGKCGSPLVMTADGDELACVLVEHLRDSRARQLSQLHNYCDPGGKLGVQYWDNLAAVFIKTRLGILTTRAFGPDGARRIEYGMLWEISNVVLANGLFLRLERALGPVGRLAQITHRPWLKSAAPTLAELLCRAS